ncbi:ATP-binding protein [Streptomyces lunaelactis]|uniref:ATP-binding protein n=1 Tax=Streptomyces lunaelactis TaxID=1535768 RepID=UPI00211D9103|nr:ATP-binding protein [Streptomyces lunaelactis]
MADTGPGIPAEELPHVFDRLWRGARARAGGGSGIGLAVVKELGHRPRRHGHGGLRTGRRDALDPPAAKGRTPWIAARSRPRCRAATCLPWKIPLGVFDAPLRAAVLSPERYPRG